VGDALGPFQLGIHLRGGLQKVVHQLFEGGGGQTRQRRAQAEVDFAIFHTQRGTAGAVLHVIEFHGDLHEGHEIVAAGLLLVLLMLMMMM